IGHARCQMHNRRTGIRLSPQGSAHMGRIRRHLSSGRTVGVVVLSALAATGVVARGQQSATGPQAETGSWTTADDHQNMMAQLGIRKLRPGPSGNESAPNHANYDEAVANPFPDLPGVLTLKNGRTVTTAEMWWK